MDIISLTIIWSITCYTYHNKYTLHIYLTSSEYDVASDIELALFGYEFIDDNITFNISHMY